MLEASKLFLPSLLDLYIVSTASHKRALTYYVITEGVGEGGRGEVSKMFTHDHGRGVGLMMT